MSPKNFSVIGANKPGTSPAAFILSACRKSLIVFCVAVLAVGVATQSPKKIALASSSSSALVAAGASHTCAIIGSSATSTTKCWGWNLFGTLGNNSTTNSLVPVPVALEAGAIAITAGLSHTCAIIGSSTTSTTKCWGYNNNGQLGNNKATSSSIPVAIPLAAGATAITAGSLYTCAIIGSSATSTTKCWGYNASGQLGNNSTTRSLVPVPVSGAEGATAITAGDSHTCAIIGSGTTSTTKCWGKNASGQLGNNSTTNSLVPVPVSGTEGATAITAGDNHTCAIIGSGTTSTTKCWGSNEKGQLGNNSTTNSLVPVPVSGAEGATAITGGIKHTCAIIGSGTTSTTKCWGNNQYSQLGNSELRTSSIPVTVPVVIGATAITAGANHNCAIIGSGTTSTTKCWGYNYFGQLGDGTTKNPTPFSDVSSLVGVTTNSFTAINVGYYASCFISGSGSGSGTTSTTKCWGINTYGQLGDGTTKSSLIPVLVSGAEGATAITVGRNQTCAIIGGTTSTTKCWGSNSFGQLGNGTTTDSSTPVTVSGAEGATAITASGSHACAIIGSGPASTTKCWGYNEFGQLGNGTFTDSSTPVTVSGAEGATAITAGEDHTCAIIGSGTTSATKCWGINTTGQLGDGTTKNSSTPVTLSGAEGATAITAGDFTCAIIGSGTTSTTKCWGYNAFDELGNGRGINSSTPITVIGAEGATAITSGGNHTCAIIGSGTTSTTKCWGSNSSGQLGNASGLISLIPVLVIGGDGATTITAGRSHTCANFVRGITSTIKCWGDNYYGQLGINSYIKKYTPFTVTAVMITGTVTAAMKRNTVPTVSGTQIAIRRLPSAGFAMNPSITMNAKKVTIQLVTPTAAKATDQIVMYLIQLRPAKGSIVSKRVTAKAGATVNVVLTRATTTKYTVRVVALTASGAIRAWYGPTLTTS